MTGLPNATVNVASMNTPIGLLRIQATTDVVTGITFLGANLDSTSAAEITVAEPAIPLLQRATSQLTAYFNGTLQAFDLPLAETGTQFQQQIWQQLKKIPYGDTRSYTQLAQAINNPKACRAVGLANRSNPFAIVVPCHRVIGADGRLTGYAGGLQRKQWLLQHEQQ